MNLKMFKRVLEKANIKLDLSQSLSLIPNTVKVLTINDVYHAFEIDENSNKKFIIETPSENKLYKAILKHFNIKLNHFGDVSKTPQPKKRV